MMIVNTLGRKLPDRYIAEPQVHLGSSIEIDVATYEEDGSDDSAEGKSNEGGVATALWAPPQPTLVIETELGDLDEYEVRVFDIRRGRRLVAAVEIVSPANKDRPEHRRAFVSKCAALLQDRVCVAIVDVVTTRSANLFVELIESIGAKRPAPAEAVSSLYVAACRFSKVDGRILETWFHALALGQGLPTLPLWLTPDLAVPLELEASYEETCRVLRIP